MLGAIIGDIVGSIYEWVWYFPPALQWLTPISMKTKDFSFLGGLRKPTECACYFQRCDTISSWGEGNENVWYPRARES